MRQSGRSGRCDSKCFLSVLFCVLCVLLCDCVFYEIYTYPNGPIFLLESVQMIQSVQQANVAIKAVLS